MKFNISAGNRHDAPEGRKLIESIDSNIGRYLIMDRAYKDDETRALVFKQELVFAVSPKKNRKSPWQYDAELYKHLNAIKNFLYFKYF